MANHLQDPLTTSLKPSLVNEEQLDEETVSLQAQSLVNTMAFPMVLKAALELGVIDTVTSVDEGVWLVFRDCASSPNQTHQPGGTGFVGPYADFTSESQSLGLEVPYA
ncbi:unnamed protein product [Microthlaspi erraticum]|uniref:Plant methyltransferase dimerisation domain-containing protein n=1 Tax=Microthlaspi erraticum TaxID=1685480 RepID=A0A6D2IC69_9BRAS|nr:unnamed protein product [Microthlaspi erraticum]